MREAPIIQSSLLRCTSQISVFSRTKSPQEIHATTQVFLEGLKTVFSSSRRENITTKTSRRSCSYIHHNPEIYLRVYTYTSELQKWLNRS